SVVNGILELVPERRWELRGMEHRGKRGRDVAIGLAERVRHALDERRGRIVRDEIDGELAADEMCGGSVLGEQVRDFIDLRDPAPMDGRAEQLLVTVVVAIRVEFEQPIV